MTTQSASSDFPIPADVEGFWAWEKGHFPSPATPLTQEIFYKATTEGFSGAMEQWVSPFGVECRAINYYGFLTLKPFDLGGWQIIPRPGSTSGCPVTVLLTKKLTA